MVRLALILVTLASAHGRHLTGLEAVRRDFDQLGALLDDWERFAKRIPTIGPEA